MPRGMSQSLLMEESDEGGGGGLDLVAGLRFLSGICPDPKCQSRLYYMSSYQSIECTGCGQIHTQSALLSVKEEKLDMATFAIKSLITHVTPQPGTDNVKVYGLSNYLCKLLSHLLSHYGMDRSTGRPKLLTEMGLAEIFNCGLLSDRAFLIDQEHLSIIGYGKDRTGAEQYLADTLNVARQINDDDNRLIPIHADGDGHCLVHAVSRALVGRELFWHPLRLNLMQHLRDNLPKYKALFMNFIDVDEWDDIINECSPNFVPKDGEPVGLRNIHIFGLANVLKRPIILLDSLSGISSSGDYSAVFLPALLSPDQCKNKDNILNCPLCIAWSSQGRNHFIPLVGIKDKPCPRLPRYMLQKTWGVHESMVDQFLAFDEQGCCKIGGMSTLKDNYIQRLVSAMEEVFHEQNKVSASLVADVHQYIFRSRGLVGATLEMETEKTHQLVAQRALVKCLQCRCLTALTEVPPEWFQQGGRLYELAVKEIGELSNSKLYTFTENQISCRYNQEKNILVRDLSDSSCEFCKSVNRFRYVRGDGSVEYHEGDVTVEPAGPNARCHCGFKHFYNGKFYDNRPREIPVPLEWGVKRLVEVVQWWENESDPELNSNVYQVANNLVQKHFPGDFGTELLQQKIVQAILMLTANKDLLEQKQCDGGATNGPPKWNAEESSKIIMSGFQSKGIHKEDLGKSETERQMKKRIEVNAPQQQAKKTTAEAAARTRDSPGRVGVTKSKATTSSPASTPRTSSLSQQQNGASTPPPKSGTPPPAPSSARVGTNSKEKKIRVVVTGGPSVTVTLMDDVTYAKLQQVVSDAVQIAPENQKLRMGFPPKILAPPDPGHEDDVVQISHGDKLSVDNTAEVQAPGNEPLGPSPRHLLRGHDAHMPSEEALLNALSARNSGGDSLDSSVASLNIVAQTLGINLWDLVQSQPHHFSQGGLYYRQAKRDVGLERDKHFNFPHFPGKTFVYNADLDRLELCIEGLGHFEVEMDVEKKAKEASKRGGARSGHYPTTSSSSSHHSSTGGVGKIQHEDTGPASFGSSGAITRPMNHHSHGAFEGLGHSLRDPAADDKMPEDVPLTESIQGAARRLQDFCDPQNNARSTIAEEPERMDTDTGTENTATAEKGKNKEGGYVLPRYTRKGPGFSVLERPTLSPADISQQELFQSIQRVLDRMAARDSDSDDDGDEVLAVPVEDPSISAAVVDDNGATNQEEGQDETMETT